MLARFLSRFLPPTAGRAKFGASAVSEHNVTQGIDWNAVYRDRYNYQRDVILQEALLAWRLNPLARRLVTVTRQYVQDHISWKTDHPGNEKFLKDLWEHPLNRLDKRLAEWSDELSLTGNLFLAITTDAAGMSYIRTYPTDGMAKIETAGNDVQQETAFMPKATLDDPDPVHILGYWHNRNRKPKTVMLHFTVNKLAGMTWGEPDLAPLLPWLARYASWLEDRVRLNRYRNAFLYIVRGKFANAQEKQARQEEIASKPPAPGSILVTDESEDWGTLSPTLDSFEANNDGLTLKKFIAAGHGLPIHWLSEPESSTRTTAEAAGTPTFKTLEERQRLFLEIVHEVLLVCLLRRQMRGATEVDPTSAVVVTAGDVSERDNAALALAVSQVTEAFGQLYNADLIDDDEYLRVVYRFAGEELPATRPPNPQKVQPSGKGNAGDENLKTDAESGEVAVKGD